MRLERSQPTPVDSLSNPRKSSRFASGTPPGVHFNIFPCLPISSRILLLVSATGVMNVLIAVLTA